jgi:hypothetical protein
MRFFASGFFMNYLLQATENNIRIITNYFENENGDIRSTTGIDDTDGK